MMRKTERPTLLNAYPDVVLQGRWPQWMYIALEGTDTPRENANKLSSRL